MPTWTNELPKREKHHGFDLVRTPATQTLQAVISSEDMLVVDTHFWHGRTTPCERLLNDEGRTLDDSPCVACQEKQAWRTHVYVSAFDTKKSHHFIFECTAHAATAFAEYRKATGTLRGCGFYANRPKAGVNSKVQIVATPVNLAKILLPAAPDVARALAVIWRLPSTAVNLSLTPYAPPTIAIDPQPMAKMRTQPDNAADLLPIGEACIEASKRARRVAKS